MKKANSTRKVKKEIGVACAECGISANVLTCLKKYGMPPKKLAFSLSTVHTATCDYCGKRKSVTEVRDYFYPDFSLLEKFRPSSSLEVKCPSCECFSLMKR